MRALRYGLAALAALVLVAAIAIWQVPQFLDWDHYRTAVERIASSAVGRPVEIRGAIHLSVLPEATLIANGVSVADTGDGASAAASEIRLRISLGALLAGRIKPLDIILHQPVVQLPWPLTTLSVREGPAPGGLHATVEDGTLAIGGVKLSAVQGELRIDPATGTLSASGLATVFGRPWRMTGRIGQAGPDGATPLSLSVDGQGPGVGTGGSLSGQISRDGGLAGDVTGRGPDLSLLLPAPALAWHGEGRLVAMGGLVVADDLDLDLGGAPARGAVSLRLVPDLRLDAALTTGRLNLDAWLPALLHGERTALPTGIDLSAEAATLAGGTLRHLRAGFDMTATGVTLRQAEAVLPGDAQAALSGTLSTGRFTGTGSITMPDVPQTLAWLRPRAGALGAILPAQLPQRAILQAVVTATADTVALTEMHGQAGGAGVAGDLAVSLGHRPALSAKLQLEGPSLDTVLPPTPQGLPQDAASLAAVNGRIAGFDADLDVTMANPRWNGEAFGTGLLNVTCRDGVLTARQVSLTGPDGSFSASGTVAPGGVLAHGRVDASFAHSESLAGYLPRAWTMLGGVLRGPGTVSLALAGAPAALTVAGTAEVNDAKLQASGALDLTAPKFTGSLSLLHPGAPRLLSALGLPGVGNWVGDGSLALQTRAALDGHGVALSGLNLSAGLLRMAGTLAVSLDGRPSITGQLQADTLPIDLPQLRSADPLDTGWLAGVDARLSLQAAQLLWNGAPSGAPAQASLTLSNGQLSVTDLKLPVAGGVFTGQATASGADLPRVALEGTLANASVGPGLFGTPLDLAGGQADVSLDLTAAGHSPAALLATMGGQVSATLHDGALAGLDLGQMRSALQAYQPGTDPAPLIAAVTAAAHSGATPFDRLRIDTAISNGIVSLGRASATAAAGSIGLAGNADIPDQDLDLQVTLRPGVSVAAGGSAPRIGLRLIGPAASASDSVDVSGLTAWLSAP